MRLEMIGLESGTTDGDGDELMGSMGKKIV